MTLRQQWVCSICGYIYEDNTPFENLSEDWICPICGEGKSVFYLQ